MLILSIDPGFDKLGYAVFNNKQRNEFEFIASHLIKTSKKDSTPNRLKQIYEEMSGIVKLYKIETVVIEQLFYFKNKKTVIDVAKSIGVIEVLASQHGLRVEYLTPLQIKQTITGYGQADKKSVQKMIQMELGNKITFKEDDESDAVACGLAFCFLNSSLDKT